MSEYHHRGKDMHLHPKDWEGFRTCVSFGLFPNREFNQVSSSPQSLVIQSTGVKERICLFALIQSTVKPVQSLALTSRGVSSDLWSAAVQLLSHYEPWASDGATWEQLFLPSCVRGSCPRCSVPRATYQPRTSFPTGRSLQPAAGMAARVVAGTTLVLFFVPCWSSWPFASLHSNAFWSPGRGLGINMCRTGVSFDGWRSLLLESK